MSWMAWATSPAEAHEYSTSWSGNRRWSINTSLSPSMRKAVRNPAAVPAAGFARSPAIDSTAPAGLRMTPAARAELRWMALAAPATVAAVRMSSPAKSRKKRRRARSASAITGPFARRSSVPSAARRSSDGSGSRRSDSVTRCLGQYLITLVTLRPARRSRPFRNSSSTRKARPTTSPLSRSTSSMVPLTVPPVANRSSTIRTR